MSHKENPQGRPWWYLVKSPPFNAGGMGSTPGQAEPKHHNWRAHSPQQRPRAAKKEKIQAFLFLEHAPALPHHSPGGPLFLKCSPLEGHSGGFFSAEMTLSQRGWGHLPNSTSQYSPLPPQGPYKSMKLSYLSIAFLLLGYHLHENKTSVLYVVVSLRACSVTSVVSDSLRPHGP